MGWTGWKGTKASQDSTVGWKVVGGCVLGFKWHIVHRLFGERKNNQLPLLLCIIGPIEGCNRKKTAPFIEEKMHFFARQIVLDNAPSHKSVKTMEKIHELRYELLPHAPYSPDLAPSDYYLFPNLK